jgi:hypothetical protein
LVGYETILPKHFPYIFLDSDDIFELPRKLKLDRALMDVKKIGLIDVIVLVNVLLLFKNRFVDDFGNFEEGLFAVEKAFRLV